MSTDSTEQTSKTTHGPLDVGEPEAGVAPYLKYIGINEQDLLVLRAMRSEVDLNAPRFLKTFYDHMQAFAGTRAFLKDEATIKRLLKGQHRYLLMFFDAKFDDEYYKHRCLIGITHFKLGLDFRWYIGAYVLYLDFLKPLAREIFRKDEKQEQLAQSAIRKAVLLDMSIVLEAYHEEDRNALKLLQAQVLQQEKLSTIGLLSTGLAHEIGNPLSSIQMICDNQLRKPLDANVKDKFVRIRAQVQRVTGIVHQLVSFARPAPQSFENTDLQQVIEPALTMAKLSRSAKNVNVKIEISDRLPAVPVIRDQLAQVLLNLFLNAFDAMQDREGSLSVTAHMVEEHVCIEIQDNGCGISESQLQLMFKPFSSTKPLGKGTGLGLYVSHGIIERHGGSITVRSQPGTGTTFELRLPRSRDFGRDQKSGQGTVFNVAE